MRPLRSTKLPARPPITNQDPEKVMGKEVFWVNESLDRFKAMTGNEVNEELSVEIWKLDI
jgi:hypothetical protein